MPNYSKKIVYLSKAQYQELIANNSVTVNGVTVTYNENDIYVTPQAEPITDVKINNISIGSNGVANIPIASTSDLGVVKVKNTYGIQMTNGGWLMVDCADDTLIKAGTNANKPLVPYFQHQAVYYGLSKLAGVDLASVTCTLGVYPDSSKAAIQNLFGISGLLTNTEASTATAAHTANSLFLMDGKLHRATSAIAIGDAVTVGTNCEVVKADEVFVKNTDYADSNNAGIIRVSSSRGTQMTGTNNDILTIAGAGSGTIKIGSSAYQPIVPAMQHEAIFYGLSKLAGVDLKNEEVTLGTFPETSKTAIRSLIGAAAASDLSNKEDKTVVVTITSTQNQNETVYTADKTFAQIVAEIEAGKTVIATTESYGWHTYYKLTDYGIEAEFPQYSFIRFSREDGQDSTRILIHYDNTIDYEVTVLSTFYGISINGTRIEDSIANIPAATTDTFGVVKVGNGLTINSNTGKLQINSASTGTIKLGGDGTAPIVPGHQHESVFYGLSKVAGVDLANETVTLGAYPYTSRVAIRKMIDALGPNNISDGLALAEDPEAGSWLVSTNVQDIQINGTSIISNGVANIPLADNTTAGVFKTYIDGSYGLSRTTEGVLRVSPSTTALIKAGENQFRPITPVYQHYAIFYGLAKAAGDTTQASSNNAVGTYTSDASVAIRTMIGAGTPLDIQINGTSIVSNGVANIPYASSNTVGVVKIISGSGISINNANGSLYLDIVTKTTIQEGTQTYGIIPPSRLHIATFYGLAKAAGDTSQASSSNAVGTYTGDAKAAIQTMLGSQAAIEVIRL